jgi:hypothetical protein
MGELWLGFLLSFFSRGQHFSKLSLRPGVNDSSGRLDKLTAASACVASAF